MAGLLNRLFWITCALLLVGGCAYNDVNDLSRGFDCTTSNLTISLLNQQNASSCVATDGSISVLATGGEEPYSYVLNDGEPRNNGDFTNLSSGIYRVAVTDGNRCAQSIQADVVAANSTLTARASAIKVTSCTVGNGSITVIASGGSPPYQYELENTGFGSGNSFINLGIGEYAVTVKDSIGCSKLLSIVVPRGNTGVSYINEVAPILKQNCTVSGCHDGSSGQRNLTNYSNVKAHADQIKTRTGDRSMPIGNRTLTQKQINTISCWVDDGALDN